MHIQQGAAHRNIFMSIQVHHQKNQTSIHYYIRFRFLLEFPSIHHGMIFCGDVLPGSLHNP